MSTHLVWDWNGTLLNDLDLVVASTNVAFASVNGPTVTASEHRVQFRRPIADYYAEVLGRTVDMDEFGRLDAIFHNAYRAGLTTCELAADAMTAMRTWSGAVPARGVAGASGALPTPPRTQSLLSMWFHDELVPTVETYGLTGLFARVDGLRSRVGGGRKAEYLARHLAELGIDGSSVVLIGDSIDDADAAEAVGARCVLYTGGFTDPARLRAHGAPVADTLTEAVALANVN